MSRLKLLKAGAALGVGGVAGGLLPAAADAKPEAEPPALRFLTQWELDYVDAMAETIWPTDDDGPGARSAGVGYYIDGQLAGSWGKGHRFYLNGPVLSAVDTGPRLADPDDAGRGLPGVPARLRRLLQVDLRQPVSRARRAAQAKAMTDLQTGRASIPLARLDGVREQ